MSAVIRGKTMCSQKIILRVTLIVTAIGLLLPNLSVAQIKPLVTLSAGYGQSYGGFGVSGQIHPIPEIGLHAGIGYFPASIIYPEYDFVNDAFLFDIGVRAYAPIGMDPFYPYVDLLFGGLGVEATQEIYLGTWGTGYYEDSEVLTGPSLLFGSEVRFELLNNVAGGFLSSLGLSYITNNIEWLDHKFMLTLDVGLSLYFGSIY